MAREKRADRVEFPHGAINKDGFLKAFAIVTRTGVFKYLNTDGTIRRELRHPDDVFSQSSMDTLKLLPLTLNHPPVMLNAENVAAYQKGTTGEKYSVDSPFLRTSLAVHHKDAIDAVDTGKSQLSLGYEMEPVKEIGEYEGEQYDVRQTEITYNHLSIVDLARAGKEANIKMDGGNDIAISQDVIKQDTDKQVTEKKDSAATQNSNPKDTIMKIVVVDGVAVQVEDGQETILNQAVAGLTQKVSDAAIEQAKLQATVDSLTKDKTDLEEKLKVANSDTAVAEKVKARVDLETKAKKIIGDEANFDGKSDSAIKQEAIKKFDADAVVGKDANYDNAYFDIVCKKFDAKDGEETPNTDSSGTPRQRKAANTVVDSKDKNTNKRVYDADDEERDEMMRELQEGKK